jgi:ABC-type multidrug transport system ATPase subunit
MQVRFKGISGGQKRRLSIAIELLRAPSIIMLDEPTSGLDATTSLKLVRTLAQLAKRGQRAMIATIHQPRTEIFDEFDQLLLLGAHCPVSLHHKMPWPCLASVWPSLCVKQCLLQAVPAV